MTHTCCAEKFLPSSTLILYTYLLLFLSFLCSAERCCYCTLSLCNAITLNVSKLNWLPIKKEREHFLELNCITTTCTVRMCFFLLPTGLFYLEWTCSAWNCCANQMECATVKVHVRILFQQPLPKYWYVYSMAEAFVKSVYLIGRFECVPSRLLYIPWMNFGRNTELLVQRDGLVYLYPLSLKLLRNWIEPL